MNLGAGVGFFDDAVGDFLQLIKIFDGAVPGVAGGGGVGNVGFVPDDPAVNAAGVAAGGFADKVGPQVGTVVGVGVEATRQAAAVSRPFGNANEEANNFTAGCSFDGKLFVADGGKPAIGGGGLHFGPLEAQARPACPQMAGKAGVFGAFDDSKARWGILGGGGLGDEE